MTTAIHIATIIFSIIAALLKLVGTFMLANVLLSPTPFWEWPGIIKSLFKKTTAGEMAWIVRTFGKDDKVHSIRGLGLIIVGFFVELMGRY